MSGSSGFPWKTVIIIVVILGVLLCCALVFGGGAAYFLSQSGGDLSDVIKIDLGGAPSEEPTEEIVQPQPTSAVIEEEAAATVEPEIVEPSPTIAIKQKPTRTPTLEPEDVLPVEEPAQEIIPTNESPDTGPKLTGKQEWSENRIFDDFSSNAFDWYQVDSESESVLVKNGIYTIHIKKADYNAWTEFPVDFNAKEIVFDVKGKSGIQAGRFGVDCNYLDDDNLYYVEFDLGIREYVITEIIDGVYIPLTKENSAGQYWNKAASMKSSPEMVNHIGISCYPDSITVFMNDKLLDQVTVKKPLAESGSGSFYAYTLPNSGENGYTIILDNVGIFQPRQ